MDKNVWVFVGERGVQPSGVFSSYDTAFDWIQRHNLSGVLTEYPLDKAAYDWSIEHGYFSPKDVSQTTPAFIGRFSSASLLHKHFENGRECGRDSKDNT